MVELFRLWKLDCAWRRSSAWAVAMTLKKFGTLTGDAFDVPTPRRKGQCVLCSFPWMSIKSEYKVQTTS